MKKVITTLALVSAALLSQAQSWQKVCAAPSGATRIETSNNGDVFVIGDADGALGNIYIKKAIDNAFTTLPGGGMVSDITAHDGKVFGIGTTLKVYEFKNNAWSLFSPAGSLTEFDYDGKTIQGVYHPTNAVNNLYYCTIGVTNNWYLVEGYLTKMVRSTDGVLVGTDRESSSYIYTANGYQLISSTLLLSSIAAGTSDNIWATSNGSVYQYNNTNNSWDSRLGIDGASIKEVSVNGNTEVWALATDGFVYKALLVKGTPITINTAIKGITDFDYSYSFGENLMDNSKTISFSINGMTPATTGLVSLEQTSPTQIVNTCGIFSINQPFTLNNTTFTDVNNTISITYQPTVTNYTTPVTKLVCGNQRPKPVCSNVTTCDPVSESALGIKDATLNISYEGNTYKVIVSGKGVLVLGLDNKTIDTFSAIIPNPATNQITVNGFAEIFNLTGVKVLQGESVIDISSLEKGIYIVKIGNTAAKLIKE